MTATSFDVRVSHAPPNLLKELLSAGPIRLSLRDDDNVSRREALKV
jgi:hypothetical protein